MRTKYITLAVLTVILSCSEDEVACRVAKITEYVGSGERVYMYIYETSGKLHSRLRINPNGDAHDDTYSFDQDGNVARIDQNVFVTSLDSSYHHYLQYAYANGKLASVTEFTNDGVVISTETYIWTGENLELRYTSPSKPNPERVVNYEYVNGNIVKRKQTSYSNDDDPSEVTAWLETIYEDFDTALTPFFVTSLARPGMVLQGISKNNHHTEVNNYHSYSLEDGVWSEESWMSEFSYTYNSSGATISIRKISNGNTYDTTIAYDGCQ